MFRLISLIVFMTLSAGSFAHELEFSTYLDLQEALAADDFAKAKKAHKKICDKELLHYTDDYKDCGKNFKDIAEIRTSFKKLSEVFITNGDKKEMKDLTKVTCSMAKAKWVQKSGPIANPYYGKSMLRCGEKI
jgi:hypothetical protein